MIDVSKCLEALRDYRRFGFGMIGGPDKKVAAKDVIEVIEGLEGHIRGLHKMVPKWISVEEKKPKRGEYVLFLYAKGAQNPVMHAKNPMVVGRYDYGMYLANGCEVNVTHWMPLPSFPGEEK